MKTKKYIYYKIIQGNYGCGWNDKDAHETLSNFTFAESTGYFRFKENLKAYRENGGGVYRVIKRRELNQAAIAI